MEKKLLKKKNLIGINNTPLDLFNFDILTVKKVNIAYYSSKKVCG